MHIKLQKELENNNISHAYFFECFNEEEALKEIEKFAMAILGRNIANNPDYKIIRPEEGKAIKIEQVRDMQKDIALLPISGKKKVYFIPDADKLNLASQNCLLKTLEEPPEYVVILLLASSIYNVIDTVKSRVKKISLDDINVDLPILDEAKQIIDGISHKNMVEVMKYSDFFDKNKEKAIEILETMIKYSDHRIKEEQIKLPQVKYNDIIKYGKYIEILNSTIRRLKDNCNFGIVIDKMLFNMKGTEKNG